MKTATNAKIMQLFIIYLLLYNLHGCTFKGSEKFTLIVNKLSKQKIMLMER